MLTGLLLKESLLDESVLGLVQLTKTETWNVSNAAPNQPQVWTALSFEADESLADEIAGAFSQALKEEGFQIYPRQPARPPASHPLWAQAQHPRESIELGRMNEAR